MLDTATFLTTVYTVLDDLYQSDLAPLRAHTPGRRPRVSDSEVLTLALLGHWYRLSERALLRRAAGDWRDLLPRPTQPERLQPPCARLGDRLQLAGAASGGRVGAATAR